MGLMAFGWLSDNVQAKRMDSEDSDSVVISGGGGIFGSVANVVEHDEAAGHERE
jgi:diacylglycerol kinase family enzyme